MPSSLRLPHMAWKPTRADGSLGGCLPCRRAGETLRSAGQRGTGTYTTSGDTVEAAEWTKHDGDPVVGGRTGSSRGEPIPVLRGTAEASKRRRPRTGGPSDGRRDRAQ